MKIELEKTMLTGMLTVLGKLVNRSAADRSFLALRLEAKDGTLSFSTRSFAEQLMYKTTIPEADSFTVYAGFDAFRDAVRASRGRNVALAYTGEVLTVSDMVVPLQEANWTPGHKYCIFDMKPGHDSVHFGNRCFCQKDRFDLKRSEIDFSMDPGTDVFPQIGFVPFALRQRERTGLSHTFETPENDPVPVLGRLDPADRDRTVFRGRHGRQFEPGSVGNFPVLADRRDERTVECGAHPPVGKRIRRSG